MNDRFVRQADLVPAERLAEVNATVIGVGAIGRQVALQLASIGVPRLQLIDFDTVDATNITTQGYCCSDLGLSKVEAVRQQISRIDNDIMVETVADRWRPQRSVADVVFCSVDSMGARAAIWRSVQHGVRFWSDGRMLGEVIRILAVADGHGRTHYPLSLFGESDVQRGRCTSHSTIYTASIAGGLMVHQFTRWLRCLPTDPDFSLNLLSSELTLLASDRT